MLIVLAVQCMRMMRACGAGLLTGETGGGGVDEAIFVRLVTHCLTTPTFLNLLLVQNVFCISFLMHTIPIQNNCLSNRLTPHPSLHMQTHPF